MNFAWHVLISAILVACEPAPVAVVDECDDPLRPDLIICVEPWDLWSKP
jgi:hypothetical protein